MARSEILPREYELKLAGTARDLSAFKRAVNLISKDRQDWESVDLETRYFDTSEQRFFKKGIAIRVRRAKEKFTQTIKADRGGGGVLDRTEWEQSVKSSEPELDALPKAARKKLGKLSSGALRPVVSLEVRRQKKIIKRQSDDGPDLEVEAVVDNGIVQAGEKIKRFSECELELLQGGPAQFFQFVTEVHNACPLRVSRITKSDRGYALLNEKVAGSVKLPKFDLNSTQSISITLCDIFNDCIGNIIDNEAAAFDGRDPEGVHQLRVSVRRLRSSLSVFHRFIEAERVTELKEELKWLGSSLGPAREWDVFLSETLASVEGYGIDRRNMSALATLAKQHRRAAYRLVRTTLRSDRYAKLILRLTAFAATEGWLSESSSAQLLSPIGEHCKSILDRPYRKLVKAGNDLKSLTPAQRHQVRIKLKKLRYTVEFLGGLYKGRNSQPFKKRMAQLQDQFGHLNDVAQTMHLVDALMRPSHDFSLPNERARIAGGMVLGWHAHHLHEIERSLFDDWSAFRSVAPPWRLGKTKTS